LVRSNQVVPFDVGHADFFHRLEIVARRVLRSVEHEVFEQVRKARLAARFVL